MRNLQKNSLLSLAMYTALVLFVLLAAVAAWQGARVSQVSARMEQGTELLQLAEVWLRDARESVGIESDAGSVAHQPGFNEKARREFFARLTNPEIRQRADDVIKVRNTWLDLQDRLAGVRGGQENEALRQQIERRFAAVTQDYIQVTQRLLNALLTDVYAAGGELKELSGRLYLLGAGLLLTLLVFAALLGWRLRNDAAVRSVLRSTALDARPKSAVATQEEINQLLQALKTIRD
ncbi:MAG: hypothetical protein OEW36_01975 [Hylemonella sp.]|nr:hypothetical protein [Hylemonella sp.]